MLALVTGALAICPASGRAWYSVWKACKVNIPTDITPSCTTPCAVGTCNLCSLTSAGATNLCNNNQVGLLRGPCRIALDALGRALAVCPSPAPSPARATDQYIGLLGNPENPPNVAAVPTGLVPASSSCLQNILFGTYPRCPGLMGAWNSVWAGCGIVVSNGPTSHVTNPSGNIPRGFMVPGLEYGGFPNFGLTPNAGNTNKNILCNSNRVPVAVPLGTPIPSPAQTRFAPSKCRRALNNFGALYGSCNAAIRAGDPLASLFASLNAATTPSISPACARS